MRVDLTSEGMPLGRLPDGYHRFARARLPAVPWRNGGGTTREVVSQPSGTTFDDFEWRVSIATIVADGPFSAFPGVDRTIMLLAGDGVRLQCPGLDHVLDAVGEPFAFSGDRAIDSTLLGGESTDLNVMTRRARCRAEVVVVSGAGDLGACGAGLVMSLRGTWHLTGGRGDEQPWGTEQSWGTELAAHEGVWWSGVDGIRRVSPVVGPDAAVDEPLLAVVGIERV